jgi:ABC-type multidrug transport system permease subunit
MRKLSAVLGKNLKLLFRNKETAYTIIIGPLLIILLVGFAFLGASNELTIRIGTNAPQDSQLAEQTVQSLNAKGYMVSVYPDAESCKESVRTTSTHACIVFGAADPETGRTHVTFYLDMSRTNLVYRISDDLSGVLDLQTDTIRQSLANDALQRISTAKTLLDTDLNMTHAISLRLAAADDNISAAKGALAAVSDEQVNISLGNLRGYQLGLAQKVGIAVDTGNAAIAQALDVIRDLKADCGSTCSNETLDAADEARDSLEQVQDNLTALAEGDTKDELQEAELLLDTVRENIDTLTARLADESVARRTMISSVTTAAGDVQSSSRDIRKVEASVRYTRDLLAGQQENASEISTPVTVSLVSVSAADDQLTFNYPYLFVMVMMFMGLLLASTLIVTDKNSRARFRNFTTPTADGFHIFVAFITAFIILTAEALGVLLVSTLFVAQPLLFNTLSTLAIVAITIVVFTFIGMIIGYLSRTQEAAMIASISVGSILLFVSNIIIPVEGMAFVTQLLTRVNPYLVLSELLKRSMLYGVTLEQVSQELIVVAALAAVLLALTLWVQRRAKRKYFRQDTGGILAPHIPVPLVLGGRSVANEVELLDCLDHMTRAEFESAVKADINPVSVWVEKELRSPRLARQLRTTSKERMMLKLDKHLQRHGKRIS